MKQYDVAIVGGGPAGAAAGHAAAEAGADAVVLEKGVPREDRDGIGPDSTDAAGILDYWVDIMGIHPDELPDEVFHRSLDSAEFIGPKHRLLIDKTGIDSSYDEFGYTFHRARMDDWMRERAEGAGAEYWVQAAVTDVDSSLDGDSKHELTLRNDETVVADRLVLADGPQRQVTNRVLDPLLPDEESITDYVGTTEANHIAYQEYREFPETLFEESRLKFWWGWMPGETAYPWVFPNDGTVARVGLTMPIGLDRDKFDADDYRLLDADDDSIPSGEQYIDRLLDRAYPEYDPDEFPRVEDRGKQGGTETYAISSTRPIDSPTGAGIAVAGGAMGTTSSFHEGGYHVAARTGAIAGELAAEGRLDEYNDAWKDAIGSEILRNVSFADIVADYEPDDWDKAFRMANKLMSDDPDKLVDFNLRAGASAAKLYTQYKMVKRKYRNGKYVQLPESSYVV